jgi:hypothetical protein
VELTADEERALKAYGLMTAKPLLVVVNHGEHQAGGALAERLAGLGEGVDRRVEVLNVQLEAEIASLDEEDRGAFLEEMGIESPASERAIRACFDLLGLVRFFTVGDDEVRAWPVGEGTPAVQAAGVIHSDLEKGFIRAEVVSAEHLLEKGSLAACREAGLLRLEGKQYRVQDGDVMHVRFNV